MKNYDDWTLPEPPPKPTPKKRGILFLSPEDMQEAKKRKKEKCIKVEDVKNLPPIEEIHGLNLPPIEKHMILILYLLKNLQTSINRHR